jgi:hypothetical protein
MCGAEAFTAKYLAEKKAQHGKRQQFERYTAIAKSYNEHANSVRLDRAEITSFFQQDKGVSASHRR